MDVRSNYDVYDSVGRQPIHISKTTSVCTCDNYIVKADDRFGTIDKIGLLRLLNSYNNY